jgi:hypothetical protein
MIKFIHALDPAQLEASSGLQKAMNSVQASVLFESILQPVLISKDQ